MYGAATAICSPFSSLVRRSKPVYITLDCKCWLAHELHFSTVANMRLLQSLRLHLYRVNFEVNDLKPFPHLAFPHRRGPKIPSKLPSFDGELMASFQTSPGR